MTERLVQTGLNSGSAATGGGDAVEGSIPRNHNVLGSRLVDVDHVDENGPGRVTVRIAAARVDRTPSGTPPGWIWAPPDFSNPFLLPLLAVVIGVLVAATLGKLETGDLWVAIPFIAFGLLAERNVWPAVMVLTPLAATAFSRGDQEPQGQRAEPWVINWAIAAILIAVAGVGLAQEAVLDEDRFPVPEAIAELQPAPLFNGSAVGGYLIYLDIPGIDVFIDDRAELYGAEGFQRFHDLKTGVDVPSTFAELGIQQAVVSAEWPLVERLELLGWDYLYQDEFFVVMAFEA